MSFIRKAHGKPRLHVSVNLLFAAWPPCCATPPSLPSWAPASNVDSRDNQEKINSWVSFAFYGYGALLGGLRPPLLLLLLFLFLMLLLTIIAVIADHENTDNCGAPAALRSPIPIWEAQGNLWVDFLMVILDSGIARGRVRTTTTTTESGIMATKI